jgi:hypothetical protein
MSGFDEQRCTAFRAAKVFARGPLHEVARAVKVASETGWDAGGDAGILVFDDETGRLVDLDLRGTVEEVVGRHSPDSSGAGGGAPAKGPGRPRLGVVGKEVTLLPRHWAWLSAQRGGASVTLRKLVEHARRSSVRADEVRRAQDAAFRFAQAMVGDEPGFEEATRALFAGDSGRFTDEAKRWPADLRDHALRLAAPVFAAPSATPGGAPSGEGAHAHDD